ncbi:hypothetical protein VNO77_27064 [Canavalia gladiata]|uniref:Uncharacterized protein n=1 Tax=Canavalia gladiata TaxID=3824 RepID=A0AAN9KW94_CANGL
MLLLQHLPASQIGPSAKESFSDPLMFEKESEMPKESNAIAMRIWAHAYTGNHAGRILFKSVDPMTSRTKGVRTKVAAVSFSSSVLNDNGNAFGNCDEAIRILVCLEREAKRILMLPQPYTL